MEEEMEIEPVFEVSEVDLDYEFDAAQFFDFTREESPSEARDAERWFESAPSYPPSPFVTKLVLGEGSLLENVTTPVKCKEVDDIGRLPENDSELEFSPMDASKRGSNGGIFTSIQKVLLKVLNQPFQLTTGLATSNNIPDDKPKSSTLMPRSSTLMKPTASQLAKQNCPPQVASTRFKKLQVPNSDRSLVHSSGVGSQAAKRQKLEGGLTHKVNEVKQQTTLVHKVPKKDVTADRNTINIKPKLTIPREPALRTAHRAQRVLPMNGTKQEHVTSAMHKFKARPLNRKVGTYDVTKRTSSKVGYFILEAPSLPLPKKSVPKLPEFQEFHLKTSERAVQLPSSVSSSSFQTNDYDKGFVKPCTNSTNRNGTREVRRLDSCDTNYNIKAHLLNKKIFSGKGDLGVSKNIKKETTAPMEYKIRRERRVPQNPPIELFSKLSLTSELQPSNGSQMKLPCPTFISTKLLFNRASGALASAESNMDV
ncbi:Leucine carboxyl methyltransferase 2 [Gossypium arboreum]|uniref:Leucine carboxyl methyltransferase 2 n=1 Tax=Gossypium arboreum TaxID=29729 RepID=A0A0B0NHP8_GOSAR|nr:Leucine carboxyl methyltransferase 2 [Gossypium arboreum]KHG24453.1 Leucine carboxyl methyltransferase 2 [Gossypium arboreum]